MIEAGYTTDARMVVQLMVSQVDLFTFSMIKCYMHMPEIIEMRKKSMFNCIQRSVDLEI